METVAEKIERFLWNGGRHVDVILESDSDYEGSIHPRILLMAFIDYLSHVAFPGEKSVGKRFVQFITRFCGWQDVERVSLLHLQRLLASENRPEFAGLKHWADRQFGLLFPIDPTPRTAIRRSGRTEVSVSVDPSLQNVLSLWPSDSGGLLKVRLVRPEDLRHGALLYQYRNHLVHEFRVPGQGWDVTKVGEPYYQKMTEVVDWVRPVRERWELVYPLGFLGSLCRNGLAELGKTLHREGRNPFETFAEGTFWLPALNP